jgi:hypothetical protein
MLCSSRDDPGHDHHRRNPNQRAGSGGRRTEGRNKRIYVNLPKKIIGTKKTAFSNRKKNYTFGSAMAESADGPNFNLKM